MIKIVQKYELQYIDEYLSGDWKILRIYKKPFMLEIIRKLPEKPYSIYDHWVLVKVFGFSNESFGGFINNYSLSNSV